MRRYAYTSAEPKTGELCSKYVERVYCRAQEGDRLRYSVNIVKNKAVKLGIFLGLLRP